jgi:hypothetical protein
LQTFGGDSTEVNIPSLETVAMSLREFALWLVMSVRLGRQFASRVSVWLCVWFCSVRCVSSVLLRSGVAFDDLFGSV